MNMNSIDPEVPRLENDPRDWDWVWACKSCLSDDPVDDDFGGKYHAMLMDSTSSLMPSGKYWMWWANSNVTEEEMKLDEQFMELLEMCAAEAGGWIENGVNGDLCDMFFCMPAEDEEEEDEDESD